MPKTAPCHDNDQVQKSLDESVIYGGYCIGCGNCAALPDAVYRIQLDNYGRYLAVHGDQPVSVEEDIRARTICPFSNDALDEDRLADEFLKDAKNREPSIGRYMSLYGGYVLENEFRSNASSGGMVTWTLAELMHEGEIDAVAHVQPGLPGDSPDSVLFRYAISKSIDEVKSGAKSRYYPVEMSGIYQYIRENEGRYAIVGVPCFIKAVRLLMHADPLLNSRIRYCISLVCGHLKSTRFSELLAMQIGSGEGNIKTINFRQKLDNGGASKYAVRVERLGSGKTEQRMANELFGSDWGMGLFKYQACDFCDDVFGETADMTAGDAWYTKFANDPRGANVVVVRNPKLDALIGTAIRDGRLRLEPLLPAQLSRTQRAGLRHRREGLSYRLHLMDRLGVWRPNKRVYPNAFKFNKRFRAIHNLRLLMARESHLVFHELAGHDKAAVFEKRMRPLVAYYRELYTDPDGIFRLFAKVKCALKNRIKPIAIALGVRSPKRRGG